MQARQLAATWRRLRLPLRSRRGNAGLVGRRGVTRGDDPKMSAAELSNESKTYSRRIRVFCEAFFEAIPPEGRLRKCSTPSTQDHAWLTLAR